MVGGSGRGVESISSSDSDRWIEALFGDDALLFDLVDLSARVREFEEADEFV